MTHSVETVFSMEDTESSDYLSSCDSVYSLDSPSSIDGDYDDDFDVFLSDGCEEEDKAAADLKGRHGDDVEMKGLVLSPGAQRTAFMKANQKCMSHKYRTQRTGLQPIRGLQITSSCNRYPFLLENRTIPSNHSWVIDKNANVSDRNNIQKREEGGLKRSVHHTMGRDRPQHSIISESPGTKRPKEREEGRVSGLSRSHESTSTEGDRLFAEKCKELQGFIQPLTALLNGLKRGRFERGLSSFQQSVAMDRIQRIVGVLQKPEMGERYLGTLLKVEMMLKVWFPHVVKSSSSSPDYADNEPQYKQSMHENRNYSERKSTSKPQSKRFAHPKSMHSRSPRKSPDGTPPPKCEATKRESTPLCADLPVMNLAWMQTSPIPNPPHSQAELGRLNPPIGQNVFVPNLNNCGLILFLQDHSMTPPTYPRCASLSPLNSPMSCHLKEPSVQTGDPPRSLSAPSAGSEDSDKCLELDRDHSTAQSPLTANTKSPWTWNLGTELKRKDHLLFST
ncbi:circadian-associated transcriptional repressor [Ambystoma mexicanum]|uniref:circadian-associated transcriptional repressor n=1 Tax=Ambystoma mexicanum TaxID=8296 RepID=UPI0037E7FDA4